MVLVKAAAAGPLRSAAVVQEAAAPDTDMIEIADDTSVKKTPSTGIRYL